MGSISKRIYSAISAAALLALSPAWSQEGAEQQSAEARVLGTVLVTAQKREENLQDVPIAITALGADDLERLGVETAAELTEFVPNVELGTNGDGASQIFIVRGVGLQDFNANNTPTTALIADDVYLPYNIMAPFTLFDMDRVEILKGPQGGLYGRNSTGGAISFVSNKATPGAPASYNASAEIGNYGSHGAKLAGSVPIGDYFAVRLAAQFDRSDGYYENTFLNENVGGVNRDLFRGTVSFEPTSTFNADLRLTYGRDRSEASIPEVVGTLDPNASQPVIDLFGLTGFFPAFNIPYTEDLSGPAYCPSFLATGIPGPDCINMARITPDGDPYKGVDERVFEFDDTFRAASLTLNWDAGPVTLVSISSWANLDYDHPNGDGVVTQNNNPEWAAFGGSGQLWQAGYTSQVEAISQEVRVLSNTTEPFNWMLGASYHQDDFSELRTTRIDENLWWNWLNFPGGGQLSYDQKTEAYSVYGQVGFDVTDRLALVVDARLTDETKDYIGNAEVSDGDLTCLLFEIEPADCVALQNPETGGISLPVLSTGDFPPYTSQYDEQVVSWKVSLDYALERGGIAYFSVGEGFKSGGIFGGFLNTPDELEPYKPEKNLAYEVGLKTRFFDDTVQFNGAVFFYDYKGWQDNLTAFSDAGAAFSGLTNLGDVEMFGADFDVQWRPAEGWELGLGVGLLETEVTALNTPSGTDNVGIIGSFDEFIDPVGNEIQQAPSYSLNALARYDFAVQGAWRGAAQLSGSYVDDYNFDVSNAREYAEDGYGKLDARLEFYNEDSGWSFALWGRNLTDTVHRTFIWEDGLDNVWNEYNAPMTVGATISFRR